MEYRNPGREPVDLASGRLVRRGGTVTLPPEGEKTIAAHDQAHIDAGRLVAVKARPPAAPPPPAPKPRGGKSRTGSGDAVAADTTSEES
ncbi:hypothetical protein [Euzebya sp.]|uniref:hypothetical protein n=1 Tax=Euzebya sp. TaxID=1971409 RepID=UPI003518C561